MRPKAQSEFTVEDHIQRQGPRFGGEQRQAFALFARFRNAALAQREEQAAVASLEKFGGFVRSGDSDVMWIGTEGALVELGKITHTERKICTNSTSAPSVPIHITSESPLLTKPPNFSRLATAACSSRCARAALRKRAKSAKACRCSPPKRGPWRWI